MPCPSCGRGFHNECLDCRSCHGEEDNLVERFIEVNAFRTGSIGAPIKNPESVTDPKSTGRKRAAVQYPIFKDQPCEWRGLKNCGGGKYPIVGCMEGLQKDLHHGPVKNTLVNERKNIHKICKKCHNRWHAKNDPDYVEADNYKLPHEPEEATELELMANEAYWISKK